jgi:hypothetical protein
MQSDGYACYETLSAKKDITLFCCMAHARRYFLEAEKNDPKRAASAIDIFARLTISNAKSKINATVSLRKLGKNLQNRSG